MNRRTALHLIATAPLAAACSRAEEDSMHPSHDDKLRAPSAPEPARAPTGTRQPAVFAAHGAPILLDDPDWMAELAGWAAALERPRAVLMISAHWEERPVTLGATRTGAYGVLLPSATRFKTEPAIEVPLADPSALFAVYALTRVVPIMTGYGKETVEGPNA